MSTAILVATSLFFIVFYLTLKLAPKFYQKWKGEKDQNFTELDGPTLESIVQKYGSNHEDINVIKQVNYYMFHVVMNLKPINHIQTLLWFPLL